jgi:hypothetical protein
MIVWEEVQNEDRYGFIFRTKVPGGWFVNYSPRPRPDEDSSCFFYPDPAQMGRELPPVMDGYVNAHYRNHWIIREAH